MSTLKYRIDHDETLKWRHDGTAYCMHIMRDNDPNYPIESDSLVRLAFFGNKAHLGTEKLAQNITPLEYLVQLCRENVDPANAVELIAGGKLDNIEVQKLPNGLITLKDGRNNDVFESVMPGAVIDVLADNLSFAHCNTLLHDVAYIAPVWAYEHSGLTISTGPRNPYADQWDSYQIGFAVLTKTDTMRNWQVTETTWADTAKSVVESVIEELDQYLTGDVWGYQLYELDEAACAVTGEPDWVYTASVWDFFGDDMFASGMAEDVGCGFTEAFEANTVESGTATVQSFQKTILGAPSKPATAQTNDAGLIPFDVTVSRVGHVTVMSTSADAAMAIANKLSTNSIQWADDWMATDAEPNGD